MYVGVGALALAGCTSEAPATEPLPSPASAAPDAGCPAVDFTSAVPLGDLAGGAPEDRCTWSAFVDVFPDARVVCSGEGSHGIVESTPAHIQLARELVVGRGYRTVAFEFDDALAALWDAFVNDGDETALAAALAEARGTLGGTKEREQLARGLRELRLELPPSERIAVRGIDIAILTGPTHDRLFAYLGEMDPETGATFSPRLPRTVMSTRSARDASKAAGELRVVIEEKKAAYTSVRASGFDEALIDVRALEEGYAFLETYLVGDFTTGNAKIRDPAMARALLAFAEKSKVMVIAHETHCAHDTPSYGTPRSAGMFAFGRAVTDALGPAYAAVGQLFSGGKELNPDGSTHDVRPRAGSLEKTLASQAEVDAALVVSRSFQTHDLSKPWTLDRFEETTSPARQLDGFVWLRTVSAARLE